MSRRSWTILVLLLVVIAIAILGYKQVIERSIAKPLIFAIVCGYIYYRVSAGQKEKGEAK
ncbi:MAG: hypothetical protein JSS82_16410 [Bacteroidetes bacterium]|nr:hypothetical protein [Bacteroidota bacterium]